MSIYHYLDYSRDMNVRARKLRKEMTRQEKKIWYDFLRLYPVKVYRQRVIDSFIVDFYCASAKLVIEVDGSQHYEEEDLAYDAWRTRILESHGLQVVRVTNYEVDKNFAGVCMTIDEIIQNRIAPEEPLSQLR